MLGYFTPDINWSVRKINGAWCLVCRYATDRVAETPEQIDAIEFWKQDCADAYDRAAGISDASNRQPSSPRGDDSRFINRTGGPRNVTPFQEGTTVTL
jgi:hypothetical protein